MKTLRNGMKVQLNPNKNCYSATICLSIEVGAFRPIDQKPGLCHMVEHNLFFSQSKKNDINEKLSAFGTFVEAFTNDMHTEFFIKTSKENVYECLKILYKQVFFPRFNKNYFLKEKSIIKEESLNQHASPMSQNAFSALDMFYENTKISGTCYGLGTPTQIDEITFEQMCEFHQQYFVPNNSFCVVCGNFDSKSVSSLLESLSNSPSCKNKITTCLTDDVGIKNDFEVVVCQKCYKSDVCCVEIDFSATNYESETIESFEVFCQLLGGSSYTSVLLNKLRLKEGYVYNLETSLEPSISYKNGGTLCVRYYVSETNLQNSILDIFSTIVFLNISKIQPKIEAAKAQLKQTLLFRFENSQRQAEYNSCNLVYKNKAFNLENKIKSLESVSTKNIKDCQSHILTHRICVAIGGGKKISTKTLKSQILNIIQNFLK